jgi:hypothetical protein
MAGNIRNRVNQLKQAVVKQNPDMLPEQPVVFVDWTDEGEPEPEPENIQVTFRLKGELVTCSLAEFHERFPEGIEIRVVRIDWNSCGLA